MVLLRMTTRRRKFHVCDHCHSREDVVECLLPYTGKFAKARRGSGGKPAGKYCDLCRRCRRLVEALPDRYVSPDARMIETLRAATSLSISAPVEA